MPPKTSRIKSSSLPNSTAVNMLSNRQNIKGYVSSHENKHHVLKTLPEFDGIAENFPRFEQRFKRLLKREFNLDTIDIDNDTFDQRADGQIYDFLMEAMPKSLDGILSTQYENKGQAAFIAIREHFLGTKFERRLDFLGSFATMKFPENGDINQFIESLHQLEKDDRIFKILNRVPNEDNQSGTDMIVGMALKVLPAKYRYLRFTLNPENLPTVDTFCTLLANATRTMKQEEAAERSSESINAVITQNRSRLHQNSKRGKKRGRSVSAGQGQGRALELHTAAAATADTSKATGSSAAGASNTPRHNGGRKFGKQRPPITCKRCLSRKGGHTSDNCFSTRWCNNCTNASHNTDVCFKKVKQEK